MKIEEFSGLVGQTLSKAWQVDGDEIHFLLADGREFMLYHAQDCCEIVTVDDVCGDLDDLGGRITSAEESSNGTEDPGPWPHAGESWTWTFYRISTERGASVIRWCGTSNGYYSESVDFCEVPMPNLPGVKP